MYFGTFGSLMSFGRYDEPFGDDMRNARRGRARPGHGSRLHFSPTLKTKVGSWVAASSAGFERWTSSAEGPLYYEPSRDTLLRVGGERLLTTSTVLLRRRDLRSGGALSYGVGQHLTYVFDAPAIRSQRIGVIAVRQFAARRFGLHAPKIGGYVSYYLSDPSRKRQLTAAMGVSMERSR